MRIRTLPSILFAAIVAAHAASASGDRPGSYANLDRPAPKQSGASPSQNHYRPHAGGHRHGPVNLFVGSSYNSCVRPFGFPGYGLGWGPSGIYFNPTTNHAEYYLPPIYAPAELNYGPLAAGRFFGYRGYVVPPAPAAGGALPAAQRPATAGEIADRLRKSNNESRQRARRFLSFGDALFQKQRFNEALQRYKSAIEASPDLAEAYYRQGFALIAVNQYELAVKAFKISLELDANVVFLGPTLEQLYDGSGLAKTSHLEDLAGRALDRGGDPDVLFLVGMFLFADGQTDRSKKFFARAAAAAGPDATFLQPLLDATTPLLLPPAKGAAAKGTTIPIKT